MKKILISFVVIFVLALLLQIDDDLSEEAQGLIKRQMHSEISPAYLYHLGIDASEDDDPIHVGQALLEEYRIQEENPSYKLTGYPESKKIPTPSGPLFCSLREETCLSFIFTEQYEIAPLLDKHKILIDRAASFYQFNEYATSSQPSPIELFPPYQFIFKANQLETLKAIALFKKGDYESAISTLLSQVSKQRHALALQDSLIGKMLFTAMLSDSMDALSLILSKSKMTTNSMQALSQAELDFSVVSAREFGIAIWLFNTIKSQRTELYEYETGEDPDWLERILSN